MKVLVLILVANLAFSGAFCPFQCHCDDHQKKVVCSKEAKLDIIPITLNPGIKEIHLHGNQIRYARSTSTYIRNLYVDNIDAS